jgi:hypothetical protein
MNMALTSLGTLSKINCNTRSLIKILYKTTNLFIMISFYLLKLSFKQAIIDINSKSGKNKFLVRLLS